MDGVQITFIANDKLVLSLKNGELYVLTLCADSMRSVRNFHFDKAAASVLTCCVSFIWFNLMNFIVNFFFLDLCHRRRISISWITSWQFFTASFY